MKKYNFGNFLWIALLLMVFATGCKPTEKNYKDAYETALKKRDNSGLDYGLGNEMKVEAIDAPKKIIYNNKEYYVKVEYVAPFETDLASRPKYMIVVAKYKMPTNARNQVEQLKKSGFGNSMLVKDRDENYLVVADYAQTMDDIAQKADDFKKKYPNINFIGLYGDILILEKP